MDKYIGTGTITLPENYSLPPLHILLSKSLDPAQISAAIDYEATCIEFGLVESGNSFASAIQNLRLMIIDYVDTTIKKLGFDTLVKTATSPGMESYWLTYRRLNFLFAQTRQPSTINTFTRTAITLKEAA